MFDCSFPAEGARLVLLVLLPTHLTLLFGSLDLLLLLLLFSVGNSLK
jgi:hypothetical protein